MARGSVNERCKRSWKRISLAFEGYTLEGPFPGAWIASDGTVFEEESFRLEVVIEPKDAKKARKMFCRFGRQLGQRAIYFELRESGEIIDLE